MTIGLLGLHGWVVVEVRSRVLERKLRVFHPLWQNFPNGLDQVHIKILAAKEGSRDSPLPHVLLQKQVVSSGGIIVPVGL